MEQVIGYNNYERTLSDKALEWIKYIAILLRSIGIILMSALTMRQFVRMM